MDLRLRDDAIAKNRVLLRVSLIWAILSSVGLIISSSLCFYAFNHKQSYWLPICTTSELSIGGSSYSASYMREMTLKVANLRLTYSPHTINERYETLVHLADASKQEELKQILDNDMAFVKKKNISSVFYSDGIRVDTKHHLAKITGMLQRTIHDLSVKSQRKTYLIQYAFNNGLLSVISVKEKGIEKA